MLQDHELVVVVVAFSRLGHGKRCSGSSCFLRISIRSFWPVDPPLVRDGTEGRGRRRQFSPTRCKNIKLVKNCACYSSSHPQPLKRVQTIAVALDTWAGGIDWISSTEKKALFSTLLRVCSPWAGRRRWQSATQQRAKPARIDASRRLDKPHGRFSAAGPVVIPRNTAES